MPDPCVLFITARSARHQRNTLAAAPDGLAVTMLPVDDRAALLDALPGADYLISERRGVVDAALFQAAPQLRLVQRIGSLTDDIDLDAARAAGVAVCYWPVGSVIRVAEHVMLQILALLRRLRTAERIALAADDHGQPRRRTDADTFAVNWSGLDGLGTLHGRTVGILGFGEIGAELARRLAGWGCTVRYHKRRRLPDAVERALALTYGAVGDLLAGSDVLVNLLPYSAATDHLLDAAALARMKRGAYLVSAGSGSVIDEAALAEAVRAGRLAGAALDTFEVEPLDPANPLRALALAGDNVLLTPHTAAGDLADAVAQRGAYYTNILNDLAGRPLRFRVG